MPLIGAGAVLGGCDPPPAREVLLGAEPAAPFRIETTNVRNGLLGPHDDLLVRFSCAIDPASVGPRSVVIETYAAESVRRRRISGASAVLEGDTLRFPATLIASVIGDDPAQVRMEGGASPCALRAADGETLAVREVVGFRRAVEGRTDMEGPTLLASRPADGATDVPPGAAIELRFSEPLAIGSALSGDGVSLRADGHEVAARLRLSADRRRMLVRPQTALAAGASVEVEVRRCLVDDAGNPPATGSPMVVHFDVCPTSLHEIEESFSCDDYLDRTRTDCAWGEIEAPGLLVPRCGPVPMPALDVEPTTDLGDRDEIRFQVRIRGDEALDGLASGLRLRFSQTTAAGPLRAVVVEGGPTIDDSLEPWFQGNRDRARLQVLATRHESLPWESDGAQGAVVDVPFEQPLALSAGQAVLLDVVLAVEPGARLAAAPDSDGRALVRGGPRDRAVPSAVLLVSGASPVARSLWYDAGVASPRWRAAILETAGGVAGATPDTSAGGAAGAMVVAEFQTAPADSAGNPDAAVASPWEGNLALVPSWRFVRFRLRFEGGSSDGRMAPVDRVLMPFERTPAGR
ncbi:MAG: Ig-like domain-containing protein [Planctomycetes bacterium]|nr:Ig-like domain-containing protein [Planctomycetota bacterium]